MGCRIFRPYPKKLKPGRSVSESNEFDVPVEVTDSNFDLNFEKRVIFMTRFPIGKADGIRSFQDLSGVLNRKTAG